MIAPLSEATRMYCRKCGYVHHSDGAGVPQCPVCLSRMHAVSGTQAEVDEFIASFTADNERRKHGEPKA